MVVVVPRLFLPVTVKTKAFGCWDQQSPNIAAGFSFSLPRWVFASLSFFGLWGISLIFFTSSNMHLKHFKYLSQCFKVFLAGDLSDANEWRMSFEYISSQIFSNTTAKILGYNVLVRSDCTMGYRVSQVFSWQYYYLLVKWQSKITHRVLECCQAASTETVCTSRTASLIDGAHLVFHSLERGHQTSRDGCRCGFLGNGESRLKKGDNTNTLYENT